MSRASERELQPGEVIADRYRLEAPSGRGAMEAVWRAVHVRLESPVAIEVLNAAIAGDPDMFEGFMREARSAAAVRSSHVAQIFDPGVDGGAPYIADARRGRRGPRARRRSRPSHRPKVVSSRLAPRAPARPQPLCGAPKHRSGPALRGFLTSSQEERGPSAASDISSVSDTGSVSDTSPVGDTCCGSRVDLYRALRRPLVIASSFCA